MLYLIMLLQTNFYKWLNEKQLLYTHDSENKRTAICSSESVKNKQHIDKTNNSDKRQMDILLLILLFAWHVDKTWLKSVRSTKHGWWWYKVFWSNKICRKSSEFGQWPICCNARRLFHMVLVSAEDLGKVCSLHMTGQMFVSFMFQFGWACGRTYTWHHTCTRM